MRLLNSRGATLIELVMAISLVAIGLATLLNIFANSAARSSDALQQQQAIIIAEGFMEEVRLQPFFDPSVDPIINPTLDPVLSVPCAGTAPALRNQFNDVCDYNVYNVLGVTRFTDLTVIAGLENYRVHITVVASAFANLTNKQAAKITVTVTTPTGLAVLLESYRSSY